MKFLITSALLLTSLSSFAKVELKTYGDRKEFDLYSVRSDKAATITVNVDVATVRVDCHGLSERYSMDELSTGEALVTKKTLMHPMNACFPGEDHVATSGINFDVKFDKSYGGYKTILVPVQSKVTIGKE